MKKKIYNWNNCVIEGNWVTVTCVDGSSFGFRSEFIDEEGNILDMYELGKEIRGRIFSK